MENDITKKIQDRLTELPADVRAAIQSVEFGKKVQAVGAKHRLHIDQVGLLEDEVLLVMLAFSEPGEFVPNLVERLGVSEAEAAGIADDVSIEILAPIRESMQMFMEAKVAKNIHEAAAGAPSTPPPPPTPRLTTIPPPLTTPPPAPKPNTLVSPRVDAVLTQKTVTPPPATRDYKTDPYKEPVE